MTDIDIGHVVVIVTPNSIYRGQLGLVLDVSPTQVRDFNNRLVTNLDWFTVMTPDLEDGRYCHIPFFRAELKLIELTEPA